MRTIEKLLTNKKLKEIYVVDEYIGKCFFKMVSDNITNIKKVCEANKNMKILDKYINLKRVLIILDENLFLLMPFNFIKYIITLNVDFEVVISDNTIISFNDKIVYEKNYNYKFEIFNKDYEFFDTYTKYADNPIKNEDFTKIKIINEDIAIAVWKFIFNTDSRHYKLTPNFGKRRKILNCDMNVYSENSKKWLFRFNSFDDDIIIMSSRRYAIKTSWFIFIKYLSTFDLSEPNVILINNKVLIYDDDRLFIQDKKYNKYIMLPWNKYKYFMKKKYL